MCSSDLNSSATTLVEGITNPVSVTGSATTSTAVTGLTNGTRYWLKVAGYNEAGEGAKSSVSAAVTPSTVPDAPTVGAPTAGSTQATARWTAPAWNGGAAVSKWYVYVYTDADGSALATGITNPQSFTGSATTSGTITGLTNGTTYWFRVDRKSTRLNSSH